MTDASRAPVLSGRFLAAVALAQEVHGLARRPGTGIPFLAHLLVVTGLVIEDGGGDDEAVAAMLHDAVESGGGLAMLARIRAAFGDRVATIVEACSDTVEPNPSEAWIARKRRYVTELRASQDDAVLRVALADKVHNARSLVRDYREEGAVVWSRFRERTPAQVLAYYGWLLAFFEERRPGPLTEDFARAVSELAALLARKGLPELAPNARIASMPERVRGALTAAVPDDGNDDWAVAQVARRSLRSSLGPTPDAASPRNTPMATDTRAGEIA